MKKQLRKKYKALRKYYPRCDDAFIKRLDKLVNKCSTVALYMAFNDEVNLESFINKLLLTKKVYLPVIDQGITFRNVTSLDALGYDKAKILAPIDGEIIDITHIDAIIAPCIAANIRGYRLGYGGGYYDMALKGYQGKKIGVVYDDAVIADAFEEEKDIPFDYLVTEKRTITINHKT